MPKEKGQRDKQRSTKHTHKTKDRVTWTPQKNRDELRCSGRVFRFCKLWKLKYDTNMVTTLCVLNVQSWLLLCVLNIQLWLLLCVLNVQSWLLLYVLNVQSRLLLCVLNVQSWLLLCVLSVQSWLLLCVFNVQSTLGPVQGLLSCNTVCNVYLI